MWLLSKLNSISISNLKNKHIGNQKTFKYAHLQNLTIYTTILTKITIIHTTILTKMTKEYLQQKKILMEYDIHSNFTKLENKKQNSHSI